MTYVHRSQFITRLVYDTYSFHEHLVFFIHTYTYGLFKHIIFNDKTRFTADRVLLANSNCRSTQETARRGSEMKKRKRKKKTEKAYRPEKIFVIFQIGPSKTTSRKFEWKIDFLKHCLKRKTIQKD